MKVKPAAEVISSTVAGNMKMIHSVSDGRKLPNCTPTYELLFNLDKYFDLTNGPSSNSKENLKFYRKHVTRKSMHVNEWTNMINDLKKITFIIKKDNERHVPPCITGWISNAKSFKWL